MASESISHRTNANQKKELLAFLLKNLDVARNQFTQTDGKQTLNSKWTELTNLLNGLGPKKSVDKWKKYWADLK